MLVLYSSELWLKTSAWTVHLNSSFQNLNNVDSWLKLNSVIMCECHIALKLNQWWYINLRINNSEESCLYSVLAKRVGYLDIILDLFNF